MAALVFKMGILVMKTLSKPLGDRFKTWVMQHPVHRDTVIHMAQRLHRVEVAISRRAEGKEGKAFVGNMTDEKSVELASKVASEAFVFSVGAALIFLEYERTRLKEVAKQRKEAAERRSVYDTARLERERLQQENREQQELINQLMSRLDRLEEQTQQMQADKGRSSGFWGGFFGPRGLSSEQPPPLVRSLQ